MDDTTSSEDLKKECGISNFYARQMFIMKSQSIEKSPVLPFFFDKFGFRRKRTPEEMEQAIIDAEIKYKKDLESLKESVILEVKNKRASRLNLSIMSPTSYVSDDFFNTGPSGKKMQLIPAPNKNNAWVKNMREVNRSVMLRTHNESFNKVFTPTTMSGSGTVFTGRNIVQESHRSGQSLAKHKILSRGQTPSH